MNEFIAFLQKYSLEILLLACPITVISFLVNKHGSEKLQKFSFYIPYVLGILFYAIYVKLSNTQVLQENGIVNQGITTGAISMLYKAVITSIGNKNSSTQSTISNLLSGVIADKDLSKAVSEIISIGVDENKKTEISQVILKYKAVSIGENEINMFVHLIISSCQNSNQSS